MGEYTCTATQAHLQPSQVEPIQKTISTSTVVDIEGMLQNYSDYLNIV